MEGSASWKARTPEAVASSPARYREPHLPELIEKTRLRDIPCIKYDPQTMNEITFTHIPVPKAAFPDCGWNRAGRYG